MQIICKRGIIMKQYRTKYKDLILEYMKDNQDHKIYAQDVYKALIKKGLNVNLVTVYRNLDKLSQSGIIQKHILSQEDSACYQYAQNQKCNDHLHLICKECGKIYHLDCSLMDTIRSHLLEEHGFMIDCKDSTLVGICKECREKKNV